MHVPTPRSPSWACARVWFLWESQHASLSCLHAVLLNVCFFVSLGWVSCTGDVCM